MEYEKITDYLPGLRRATMRAVPYDDVDDVWQEFLIAVINANFAGKSTIKKWLNGILKKRIADYYRGRYKYRDKMLEYEAMQDEALVYQNTCAVEVEDIFRWLTPRQGEFIRLYYLAGMNYYQISDATGETYEAIRSCVRRGIKKIQENI